MDTTTTTTTGPDTFGFDLASVPDELRDRVAALIPNPGYGPEADGGTYISRTMNGVEDMTAFAGHMVERESILITGPASVGKTFAAKAFAARHRLPFVALNVNGGIDPVTIWGQLLPDPADGRSLRWVWSDAALIVLFGGILLFDEINMAHESVLAGFNSLTDDRRGITVNGHNGEFIRAAFPSLIVGTMNPTGGTSYRGTRELNGATSDRFCHMVWNYDRAIELRLVASPTLVDLAEGIRAMPEVSTPVGTRALMVFERSVARFGIEYASARFIDRFRESERAGVRRSVELSTAGIMADLDPDADPATDPTTDPDY